MGVDEIVVDLRVLPCNEWRDDPCDICMCREKLQNVWLCKQLQVELQGLCLKL